MDLDLSELDPAEAAQAQVFATMVQGMPTEAVEFLITLLQHELATRDD
jgi:hypothetical protein